MFQACLQPFHRTHSLDYGIVAKGTIVLELDDGKRVTLKEGDTIVQRGTIHAWRNESTEWARIYFIVLGEAFFAITVLQPKRIAQTPAQSMWEAKSFQRNGERQHEKFDFGFVEPSFRPRKLIVALQGEVINVGDALYSRGVYRKPEPFIVSSVTP